MDGGRNWCRVPSDVALLLMFSGRIWLDEDAGIVLPLTL